MNAPCLELLSALDPFFLLTPDRDPAKAQAVQELFERYNASLAATGSFPPVEGAEGAAAVPETAAESPQTRVWVLYFLAQHYDHMGWVGAVLQFSCFFGDSTLQFHTVVSHCRSPEKALALVDEALTHTPTLVELYNAKVLWDL